MADPTILRPQPGPQEKFLASPADIAIYGGAAGGGKTWALLVEPLRHIQNKKFGAVIFRRTYPQITMQGGMWDESSGIYPRLGAKPNQNDLDWRFPSGARVSFAHLQYESSKFNYDGAQIALLEFDQLEHFSESMFFYLLQRNRSTCGVQPYVRGSCNPDPDSFVAEFLAWWINQETGYPIPERAGILRWFVRIDEQLVWADTAAELRERYPKTPPKSVTFFPARVEDNQILLEKDPGYLANLMAQPLVERERKHGGNWKIRATAGKVFKREWFEIVDAAPADLVKVRYYDLAGTEPPLRGTFDPDWTRGVLMGMDRRKVFYILDIVSARSRPADVEELIKQTAQLDGKHVPVWIEKEPGASGKGIIDHYQRNVLPGYAVRGDDVTGNKLQRADPLSAQAETGNVKLVHANWNKDFLDEAQEFPTEGVHDDQVDAASGAFKILTLSQGSLLAQEARDLREKMEAAKKVS